MTYYISCGAQGKMYTLRNSYIGSDRYPRDQHVMSLSNDLEEAKAKAAAKGYVVSDIRVSDKLAAITRRSDVDWTQEPVDFGKYSGQSLDYIAKNDSGYFLWVLANGSKKWKAVAQGMIDSGNYPDVSAKYTENLPENKTKNFASIYPDVAEFLEGYKVDVENLNGNLNFFNSLYLSYVRGQNITDRAIEIVRSKIEQEKKYSNVESDFVGKIKERKIFSVVVERVTSFEAHGYTYSHNIITKYVNSLRDCNGNSIVYIGETKLGNVGEKVNLKATIKSHDVYKGTKQTVISRPTILEEV